MKLDCLAVLTLALACCQSASAASYKPLYTVQGSIDGSTPSGMLTQVGTYLYGEAAGGGYYRCGTIFQLDPATGQETTVYTFTCGSDGSSPQGRLTSAGGLLYGTTRGNGAYNSGTLFSINPTSGAFTLLHAFGSTTTDGFFPEGALLNESGVLWGVSIVGGSGNPGTLYTYNIASSTYRNFTPFKSTTVNKPSTGLIDIGGTIVGCGTTGPADQNGDGGGGIFTVNPATGNITTRVKFKGESSPSTGFAGPNSILYDNGMIYGATTLEGTSGKGMVFAVNPANWTASTVYSFQGAADGNTPTLAPFAIGGQLYGIALNGTQGAASIFSLAETGGTPQTLQVLQSTPTGGISLIGGQIYTATYGGVNGIGNGVILKIDPTTGASQNVYVFTGFRQFDFTGNAPTQTNSLVAAAGKLALTSKLGGAYQLGDVVTLNPATGKGTELAALSSYANGVYPIAPLIAAGGVYYGTTSLGGNGGGSVFSVNAATGTLKTLYVFGPSTATGNDDPANPAAALLVYEGQLYGTSVLGGAGGVLASTGTVFSVNPHTGKETHVLVPGSDLGSLLYSNLLPAGKSLISTLYSGGTPYGDGAVFSVNPTTATGSVIYAFKGPPDASNPFGAILQSGGVVYGVAIHGGAGFGALYAVNEKTGAETVLHAFTGGADGAFPTGALTMIGDVLYGATAQGGANNQGVIFSYNLSSGAWSPIYSVGTNQEGSSLTSLVPIGKTLYGVTSAGGGDNLGTVFSITP